MEVLHFWAAMATGTTCCMVVSRHGKWGWGGDQKSQDVMSCGSESALSLACPIPAHVELSADIGRKSWLLHLPFPSGLSPLTCPYTWIPSSDR